MASGGGGGDLLLKGIVEFLMKGKGLDQAKKGTKKLGDESKKTTKQLGLQAQAGQELGRKLQTFLGVAAITALVKSSVTEFAKYERGLLAIGSALGSMGIDQDAALPKIRAFFETLEAGTGVLRQEALPVFQKFVGIIKDVEGAMFVTTLAADLTNAGLGDMKVNAERVANLLQGEVTEAAKALGLQLRNTSGAVKTQVELLDELINTYSGFSATTEDTQTALEKMGAEWNELKQSLGAGVSLILGPVSEAFSFLVELIKTVGLVVGVGAVQMIETFKTVGKTLFAVFDIGKLISEGPAAYWDGVAGAFTDGIRNIKALDEGFFDELKAIWTKGGEEQEGARQEAIEKVRAIAAAKQREIEEKEAARQKEKAARAADQAAKEEERLAARRVQVNQQAADAILQARIRASEEFSREREALEVQLLERQRTRAIAAAKLIGADVALIEEAFDLERENLEAEADKARIDAALEANLEKHRQILEQEIEFLESKLELLDEDDEARLEIQEEILGKQMELELAGFEGTAKQKRKIEDKFANKAAAAQNAFAKAAIAISDMEAQSKMQNAEMVATLSINALGAIFGESKALAIAQTMIETFFGAQKAFAANPPPSPIGAISAALVVAAGVAAVAKITSSSPAGGGGFDDPIHDRLARMGGRKWATDLLGNIDLGFQDGIGGVFDTLSAQGTQQIDQSSVDNSQTNNFGAVMGGRAGARQIVRQLDKARHRDQARGVR